MSDSAVPLLKAVKVALKGNSVVQGLAGGRVYAGTPKKPQYPFINISCESAPFSTDDTTGMEHTVRVQAFARENKPGTVLALRAAAYDALNRQETNLALPDHDLTLFEHEGLSTAFPEGDGRTHQSVIEFKALVQ